MIAIVAVLFGNILMHHHSFKKRSTSCRLNLCFKIRFVKIIITLSVSVDLPYLHILLGNIYTIPICITSASVWTCNKICSDTNSHFLCVIIRIACMVSCISDSWVAYGLVILFSLFFTHIIIFSFGVQTNNV